MKKIALLTSLVVIIQTNLFASSFGAVLYAPTSEDRILEGVEFKDLSNFKIKFGSIGYTQGVKRFGWYGDIGLTSKEEKSQVYQNTISDAKYSNVLVNVGSTFSLSDHIVLFGGVGLDYSTIEFTSSSDEKESESKFNLNGGAMWFYKSYGLIAGFDSANKAVNLGLTYKF